MYILLYLSINIDMTIIQICVKLYVYMMNSYILSVVQTDMNRYNPININYYYACVVVCIPYLVLYNIGRLYQIQYKYR